VIKLRVREQPTAVLYQNETKYILRQTQLLVSYTLLVVCDVILFHFNIILKNNGMFSTTTAAWHLILP